jgi:dihydroxy-acid dehydratase
MNIKKEKNWKKQNIDTIEQFEQFREEYGHRCIFKAMGFTSQELSLPRIAVVNSWSEQSPGHIHLRTIAEGVKAGVRLAGGMPFEINVIGPCTMLGKTILDAAHYDLPQREAILASIESALHVGWCDGWVGIGSCDKIVPGMVLAALRLNRPFIFIGGGQMIPSEYEGKNIGYVEGQEIMIRELQKLKDNPDLIEAYERKMEEVTDCCGSSPGACGEMSTGNTLAILTEAMGFSLPGSSTTPGVMAEKIWESKEVGQRIVDLAIKGIKPSDMFTIEALKNAIAIFMAICGGTNSLVHLQCYAHEAGIPCTLDTWDEISRKVPALCGIAPSGPYMLYDFHKAGGLPALMKRIKKFLHEECLTVTGQTVGENIANVRLRDSDVIRPLDKPISTEGGVAILRGNLAPRGAVTRHTVVENKDLFQKVFNARVFNSLHEAIETLLSGSPKKVEAGDALVIRYIGPRGGPAMPCGLSVIRALKLAQVKDIAIITDGRFSGFTKGYLAIGHVCPEAQVGGTLALLQDGDQIHVDIPNRRLDVEITEEEMARRRSRWTPPDTTNLSGVIAMYARTALQADQGAGWPVRGTDFDWG